MSENNYYGKPFPGGKPWGYMGITKTIHPKDYNPARDKDQVLLQEYPNREPYVPHPVQDRYGKTKYGQHGKRPNILLFVVDDVGWMDWGPYGGGVAVGSPTPNINKLARDGLVLTSCYSQPSCSSARATIHTGQLPVHHGILAPGAYGTDGGTPGLNPRTSLPTLLGQAGYQTRCVGKWHMGEDSEKQPHHVGYDHFYGFLGVSEVYTEWRDPYFQPEIANNPRRYKKAADPRSFDHDLVEASKGGRLNTIAEINLETIQTLDEKFTEHSEQFIKDQQGAKKPFFLYHATRGAHFDNYPSKKYRGQSPGHTPHTDTICELDAQLGRLVAALEETGQLENTLIFVTSDNGPEVEITPHGRTPFRGSKGSSWEGGVRVPAIAYWKGMIEHGRSDGLFDLADLYPTFLQLAGGENLLPTDSPDAKTQRVPPPRRTGNAARDAANMKAYEDKLAQLNAEAQRKKNDPTETGNPANHYYIYGIDQSWFLLGKGGTKLGDELERRSYRRSVFYWTLKDFVGVRMDEFKLMTKAPLLLGLNGGHIGGFSTVNVDLSYSWLFNLYSDPQEQNNLLIRYGWCGVMLQGEYGRFVDVLADYPPNPKAFPQVGILSQPRLQQQSGN